MNEKPGYSLKKTELIEMEAPQDMMELTLWSTYVKNERGVSLLFLAHPESAKTQLMMKYRENKGVFPIRRFTAYGLIRDLCSGKIQPLFPHLRLLGVITIYDYSALLSFKANTVDSNIEFVNAFTEDGLSAESAFWISADGLSDLEGLKGGIIAAITPFGFFTIRGSVKAALLKGGCLADS